MIRGLHILTWMAGIVLLSMFVGSCYTEKKAGAQADHIARAYPGVLASACNLHFPVITTGTDTVRHTDSIPIWIECPGTEENISELSAEDYAGKETAGAVITAGPSPGKPPGNKNKKDSVLVKVPVRTVTITKTTEDTRKLAILQAEKDKESEKAKTYRTWLIIGFSLAGSFLLFFLLLGYFYLKIKKEKLT